MDLDDLELDLSPAAVDRTTKRGKTAGTKDRLRRSNLTGGQKGANTMAMRFRKAPINLPVISIQKRGE